MTEAAIIGMFATDDGDVAMLREAFAQARADERRRLARLVEAALTDEDEIAHGEAVTERGDGTRLALGFCVYCDDEWPCRTQQGIDRLLALLSDTEPAP